MLLDFLASEYIYSADHGFTKPSKFLANNHILSFNYGIPTLMNELESTFVYRGSLHRRKSSTCPKFDISLARKELENVPVLGYKAEIFRFLATDPENIPVLGYKAGKYSCSWLQNWKIFLVLATKPENIPCSGLRRQTILPTLCWSQLVQNSM
jgi:hypothetical protein